MIIRSWLSQVWSYMRIIPAIGRQSQEDRDGQSGGLGMPSVAECMPSAHKPGFYAQLHAHKWSV